MKTFGEKLRNFRIEAEMSQKELAEASSVPQNSISQLETGTRRPTWDNVQALAKALGIDCTEFLDKKK